MSDLSNEINNSGGKIIRFGPPCAMTGTYQGLSDIDKLGQSIQANDGCLQFVTTYDSPVAVPWPTLPIEALASYAEDVWAGNPAVPLEEHLIPCMPGRNCRAPPHRFSGSAVGESAASGFGPGGDVDPVL